MNGFPSTRHSNVEAGSLDENRYLGFLPRLTFFLPLIALVSGGVVSATGAGSKKTRAEPWSVLEPMASAGAPATIVVPSTATALPSSSPPPESAPDRRAVSVRSGDPTRANVYAEPWFMSGADVVEVGARDDRLSRGRDRHPKNVVVSTVGGGQLGRLEPGIRARATERVDRTLAVVCADVIA